MKTYWIGHCRGPNFELLKKKGFLVFYPTLDDYVFLEASEKNLPLLRKQSELGVMFLKDKGKLLEVTEAEIEPMLASTTDLITPGSQVKVLEGYCENLEGEVLSKEGTLLRCILKGYNRSYEVELEMTQVVLKSRAGEKETCT